MVIDKERSLLYGPSRLEQLQYIATGGMCFIQCPFSFFFFLLSPFPRRHCRQEESKLLTNPAERSACEISSSLARLFLPTSLYQSPSLEANGPSARQKKFPRILLKPDVHYRNYKILIRAISMCFYLIIQN